MFENLPITETILKSPHTHAILEQHHLKGLFFHLMKIKDETLLKQYKMQWIHNQLLIEEIKGLKQEGVLLKGAALLLDIYPDLGSRFLSDVDILIDKNNYPKWEKNLKDNGFTPLEIPTFFGNHFKSQWVKLRDEVEINFELHTQLFFHLKDHQSNLIDSPINGFKQMTLEDNFLHLAGHLAFQHTFLKLYWLYDIYFFVEKYNKLINWNLVEKKSKEQGLFNSVQMCLWCLNEYFSLDQALQSTFNLDKKYWWQQYLTMQFLLYPDQNKIPYYLIKHATKDNLKDSIGYDITWFWHYKLKKFLPK